MGFTNVLRNMMEEYDEIDFSDRTVKPVLYFAHYINIGGKSPQRVREILIEYYSMLQSKQDHQPANFPYDEKHFVLPITQEDSRIELLYPSPVISQENVQQLYEKYVKRMDKIVSAIKEL